MHFPLRKGAAIAALLMSFASPALAQDWQVDHTQSSLKFEAKQSGNIVTGTFGNWNAKIDFDTDNLKASNIQVRIDMTSVQTGNATIDQTLLNSDWFDTSNFTSASFVSTKITKRENGNFEAAGTLTIRNRSQPLSLPFSLTVEDGVATVSGATTVLRTDYELGMAQPDNAVAGKVSILFALKARKS
ncbi:MAG: YceI family protein [Stappiaceae bacterium]